MGKPMSRVEIQGVVWITAAVVLACSSSKPSDDAAPPGPPPPRFWLRDQPLAETKGATPDKTVVGPALVELLADGEVLSPPETGQAIHGFLPDDARTKPGDRRGLMLYGQRISDLHLDSPTGPVVGRIHPGAFLSVAPHDETHWQVAVPRYSGLLAYVEKSALGPTPQRQVTPVQTGKRVEDFGMDLWTPGGTKAFTTLLCGDFHVQDQDGGAIASQYYDGIEITGRLDTSQWIWGEHGETRCLGRLVYDVKGHLREGAGKDFRDSVEIERIPEGYVRVQLPPVDPFVDLMDRRASFFWLVETKRGLECHEWKVATAARERKAPEGPRITGKIKRLRDPIQAELDAQYHPSSAPDTPGDLALWGPHFKEGGYKCGRRFSILASGAEWLYVDNPGLRKGPVSGTLVAFHPADVEHWFLTSGACQAAKTKADEVLARDRSQAKHLGMHFDCFDRLME
ncbi:MAG: hypothetical protein R3B70_26710 [Polyangiaceae bacterium]